jgi:hypothetical protein
MCLAEGSKPAVSQCFQPAGVHDSPGTFGFRTICRLEIGDTAGWETCATASAAGG